MNTNWASSNNSGATVFFVMYKSVCSFTVQGSSSSSSSIYTVTLALQLFINHSIYIRLDMDSYFGHRYVDSPNT
jgi:hypothetical protein